ncbi:MAG: TIR domain-containing protein [Hyphomonadaceae bacterium]|nr:TIR domain-containing protein [Hyphomonadaceae bacterium]
MADVFISYKRDERSAVEQIAARLNSLGLTIWFDAGMSAGESFNSEIDREARAAKAILVCWSPAARQSEWVNAEAMIGFEQKKLAACYVAGPDNFSAPTPFNATHAEDLRAWLAAPSETHSGWKSVLRRIGQLCGRSDVESFGALDAQADSAKLRTWIETHEGSPLFMTVDSLLRARDQDDAERARLEVEARALRATEQAERRAREADAEMEHAEAERRAKERADELLGRMFVVAAILGVLALYAADRFGVFS